MSGSSDTRRLQLCAWPRGRRPRHEAILTRVDRAAGADRDSGDADSAERTRLPVLLTVDEAAGLLRTTRRGIYAMIERRQLPGVIRIRRRVLVRAEDLLHWLDQKRAPSPEE